MKIFWPFQVLDLLQRQGFNRYSKSRKEEKNNDSLQDSSNENNEQERDVWDFDFHRLPDPVCIIYLSPSPPCDSSDTRSGGTKDWGNRLLRIAFLSPGGG